MCGNNNNDVVDIQTGVNLCRWINGMCESIKQLLTLIYDVTEA